MLTSQMDRIKNFVPSEDLITIKIIFYLIGGMLLDENFKVMNINEFV